MRVNIIINYNILLADIVTMQPSYILFKSTGK